MLSQNEVIFYCTRAAVGVGAPYGLAEEFAHWAVWFGCSDLDPAPVCLAALKSLDEGRSDLHGKITRKPKEWRLSSNSRKVLSAIQTGCFVTDWLSDQHDDDEELVMEEIDSPFLVAAAVGTATSKACSISWNNDSCRMNFEPNQNWELFWDGENPPEISGPSTVILSMNPELSIPAQLYSNKTCNFEKTRQHSLNQGISTGKEWNSIMTYFKRCLVPSTTKSREVGAGAGLVDTD